MKILYHHRTTARDGSAVHIQGLIGALRQLGAEVQVVAPPIAADKVDASSQRSLMNAARGKLPRFAHELAEFAYNIPEAAALARSVRQFRPDLIYQRSNLFLLSGSCVAKRAGLPLIEEVNAPYFLERSRHGGIALSKLAAWTEHSAWRRAGAVVTVTSVLADMVAEQGVPRDALHVMPNGVDEGFLRPDAIDREAKNRLGLASHTVLGFTGFVRHWNGLEAVLEELARPAGRSCFLLVVGDGPARGALERRANELGVSSRVRFTGIVQRSEIAGYVSAFDIALQPAANPYASPLKLFEYMALGRAIVAPDQPNIREILTDGQDAILFPAGDTGAFGVAIRRLAGDLALRGRISSAAVATLGRRRLTWRNNAQRVLEIGERLIASSPSKALYLEQDAQARR